MRHPISLYTAIVVLGLAFAAHGQIVFPDGTTLSSAVPGTNNSATGAGATIGGGTDNTASGESSTVSGGFTNAASDLDATVSGGSENIAGGLGATVSGGQQNLATGDTTTIGGGFFNDANFLDAVIAGGSVNLASGEGSTVAGGFFSDATALQATVGGGSENVASGVASTIPGGSQNFAAGDLSFAAGFGATVDAEHDGAMLFADSREFFFFSERANEFAVRGTGGFRFVTEIDEGANGVPSAGVGLLPGGSQFFIISDRNAKTNFEALDTGSVLDRVANMPIQEWNYKTHDDGIRHIGPMAQDFRAAFGLGYDDKHLSAMDVAGVALVAIQGLNTKAERENAELHAELRRTKAELAATQAKYDALAQRLDALEQKLTDR